MHMYRFVLTDITDKMIVDKLFQLFGYWLHKSQISDKRRQSHTLDVLQRPGKQCYRLTKRLSNHCLIKRTLFFVCAGNELFFVSLYLMKWTTTPTGLAGLRSLTYPQLMALVTFPIFAIKNIINIVQLWKASKILVGVDLAERAASRVAKQLELEGNRKT